MGCDSDQDDFLDLCQRYGELAEYRRLLLLHEYAENDEVRAEQIDDIDAQLRILMWRILCSGEQALAEPADEPPASIATVAQGRETGGAARGRFASATSTFARPWSIFAQR